LHVLLVAMMRLALMALACASSALAGSISLRGAVTGPPQQEEHVKSAREEGKPDPCEAASSDNVSHSEHQDKLPRNASHEAMRNGTHELREPKGEVVTLYHQTSAEIGALIFEGGFKPGKLGWCGGGIYFAVKPWETYHKAIGPNSHLGFIIEVQVDLGKVRHMPPTCDRSMSAEKMVRDGYDTIRFNPGDGDEIVVYSPESILSIKHFTWS